VNAAPRRQAVVGLIVGAAVVLGGCASVSDDAQNSSLAALATQAPAPRTYEPPGPKVKRSCDRLFDSPLPPPRRGPGGSYMERIRTRGTLRVGVDQNTLRLGHFDRKDKAMEGLDIDLLRAVARAIFGTSKNRIVFKAISTAQRESVIESGEVDIVASAFSITCERLQNMYFSSVYYTAQQKLLVLQDSTDDSLADLRGKEVCATKSSTSIKNLAGTGVVPHPVELRPDCLVELQEGNVAAITADDSILFGFKQQDRQTKIVGRCINVERYGMAINRRHPEFVRFVDEVLRRLGRAGLERIRHRWLNGLTAPTPDEISRCDRRSALRRAANHAAQVRRARHARDLSARWCREVATATVAAVLRDDRRCAPPAAPRRRPREVS
jgi:polar amino acid transport system substrate-binding protein